MGLEINPLHVRRSGFIEATPLRVWEEFGSQSKLAAWFGHGHTLERFTPTVGSEVLLSVENDGVVSRFGGRLLVHDAGRELSFESNWHDGEPWPVPMFQTIRLSGLYSGTLVEIFHHGFERLGAGAGEALENYEAGWSNHHIERLRRSIE